MGQLLLFSLYAVTRDWLACAKLASKWQGEHSVTEMTSLDGPGQHVALTSCHPDEMFLNLTDTDYRSAGSSNGNGDDVREARLEDEAQISLVASRSCSTFLSDVPCNRADCPPNNMQMLGRRVCANRIPSCGRWLRHSHG